MYKSQGLMKMIMLKKNNFKIYFQPSVQSMKWAWQDSMQAILNISKNWMGYKNK